MEQRFTHVAVTVDAALFEASAQVELLGVYANLFGWSENPSLSIPGKRIFLRAPSDGQYITIRAAEQPMETSGYEHLGLWLPLEDLHAVYDRAAKLASTFPDLELTPIRSLYNENLLTFRLHFRLPLTIEIQHFDLESPS